MRELRKTIYLLNIGDYEPALRALCRPSVDAWADKINADVVDITSRRFPEYPVNLEKLQVAELAKARGDDWAIYLDSDALVHPETPDFTTLLEKKTVAHNGADFSGVRWRLDEYMLRDGRNIGSCTWLAICSDWTLDLWAPPTVPVAEMLERIHPTVRELQSGVIDREHLLDDYLLSRNIARYGLDFAAVMDICPGNWFLHLYACSVEEKLEAIAERLTWRSWGGFVPDPVEPTIQDQLGRVADTLEELIVAVA